MTSGTPLTTTIGSHTVSEAADAAYTAVIGGDCAANGTITLAAGDDKSCTITNTFKAPKLTVTKSVVNDNGGAAVVADFTLKVNATTVTSGAQNTFDAGSYTVSETGPGGYLATFGGACAADGTVTLAAGDVKSCTITNNDIQPKLTVTKIVVNDNGGTFSVSSFTLKVNTTTVTSGAENGFNAGTYTISETGPTNRYFAAFSGDCDAETRQVTLAPGDVKSCTITNDDLPGAFSLSISNLTFSPQLYKTPGIQANHDLVGSIQDHDHVITSAQNIPVGCKLKPSPLVSSTSNKPIAGQPEIAFKAWEIGSAWKTVKKKKCTSVELKIVSFSVQAFDATNAISSNTLSDTTSICFAVPSGDPIACPAPVAPLSRSAVTAGTAPAKDADGPALDPPRQK